MNLSIIVSVEGDRVVALCGELSLRVEGEYLKEALEELNLAIVRKFYADITSGVLDKSDPDLIQLIAGNDGEKGLDLEMYEIEHDIYMDKIERLMREHYPSLMSEGLWRMIVPRHNVQSYYENEESEWHKAFVVAETQEREAYDDLDSNGPSGAKWQAFLADYMADPSQHNKKFLIKHGLVMG
jgi:hypothetical protein